MTIRTSNSHAGLDRGSGARLDEQVQGITGGDPVRARGVEVQVERSTEHSLPQFHWEVTCSHCSSQGWCCSLARSIDPEQTVNFNKK